MVGWCSMGTFNDPCPSWVFLTPWTVTFFMFSEGGLWRFFTWPSGGVRNWGKVPIPYILGLFWKAKFQGDIPHNSYGPKYGTNKYVYLPPCIGSWSSHWLQVFSIISFTVSSAVVLLSAYLQSHLLIGLDKSLDCWCCSLTTIEKTMNQQAMSGT